MAHRSDPIEPGDEEPIELIGDDGAASAPDSLGRPAGAPVVVGWHSTIERSLLRWPLVGVAVLLAGIVWFARPTPDAAPEEAGEEQPTLAPVDRAEGGTGAASGFEDGGFELRSGFDPERDGLFLVKVPVGAANTFDPSIVYLVDGDRAERPLGERMSVSFGGLSRPDPGESRDPLMSTAAGLVVTGVGRMWLQPRDAAAPATDLGEGIAALAGPDPGQLWTLGSGERTARLIDLRTGQFETFALDGLGRPVASAGAGLILAARRQSPADDFFYWDPDRGVVDLRGTDDVEFVGAGGPTVAFEANGSLLVFDLEELEDLEELDARGRSGGLDGRSTPIVVTAQHGSAISPDGRLVAITVLTPITEPDKIQIRQVDTGEIVSEVTVALTSQYRWSSATTLLYQRPRWPSFSLVERDMERGTDRELVEFADFTWWYTHD